MNAHIPPNSPTFLLFRKLNKRAAEPDYKINNIPCARYLSLTQGPHHDRRPSPRRSNTIAKSQAATRSDESCRFFIGLGNNGELVRRVLSTRSQWSETGDGKELFVNLRWQQSNKTYKYENCIDNRIFKHSLNHFEYHHELSNKEYLFHNLLEYCEGHKINVF